MLVGPFFTAYNWLWPLISSENYQNHEFTAQYKTYRECSLLREQPIVEL